MYIGIYYCLYYFTY